MGMKITLFNDEERLNFDSMLLHSNQTGDILKDCVFLLSGKPTIL